MGAVEADGGIGEIHIGIAGDEGFVGREVLGILRLANFQAILDPAGARDRGEQAVLDGPLNRNKSLYGCGVACGQIVSEGDHVVEKILDTQVFRAAGIGANGRAVGNAHLSVGAVAHVFDESDWRGGVVRKRRPGGSRRRIRALCRPVFVE